MGVSNAIMKLKSIVVCEDKLSSKLLMASFIELLF